MRVAVIGLGEAGGTLHLPALSGLPSARLVGVCDRDAERLNRVAARWRVPGFADPEKLLAEAQPEVVLVCTPPEGHAEICLQALGSGAHVLCEKPFAATLHEADAVLQAAAEAQRQVAVNHEFREMPIHRAVLEAARSGRDGQLVFAQVWQQMDLAPWTEAGWRGQLRRRTLFEAGVHLLDLLVALYGEFPAAVQASTSAAALDREERDAIVIAVLEFSRGRLGVLTQNRLCRGERQYFEVRADLERASWRASFGGRARISAGLHRSTRLHVRVEYGLAGIAWREIDGRRAVVARNPRDPNVAATRSVLDQTLTAFRNGTEPPTSGARARRLLELIEACYESASAGRRVGIPAPVMRAVGLAN